MIRTITCWIVFFALSCYAGGRGKPRVLYITTTAGFHHSACEYSIPVIKRIAERSGAFEVVCTNKTDLITPQSLKDFAAVCFSNTTGDLKAFPLSEKNRNALIEAVRSGMAFIGIHAATDTFKDWPPYYEMLGGTFNGHPWHEKVMIDVEDPSHPAAVMLPSRWVITDEIYTFKNYSRKKVHVILSLNPASEKGKGNRADHDYALAWAKRYGKGRVFYTALGHRHEVWDNPLFQEHLLGGILWALGLKLSPITPGHSKSAGEWRPLITGSKLNFGTDWETTDDPAATRKHWTLLPGGILQGKGVPGTPGSSHIYYIKKAFRNFEARAEICINKQGNSGWYFRCPRSANFRNGRWRNWPVGYEFQINNHSGDPKRTGTFYPKPTLWDADIARLIGYDPAKDDGNFWFRMHIIAVGNHFICKLNGKVAVDHVHPLDPTKPPHRHSKGRWEEGLFAFQMHHFGTVVKIKNPEVRQLAPDFSWSEP